MHSSKINTDIEEIFQQNPEGYLASIVTNSNDAIIGKTLAGIVTSWNPAAENLYGYKKEDIIGKSINLIYPPERKKELKEILRKISLGEKIESFQTIRLRKDGSKIDVTISVSPIKNLTGNIIGCSDLTRDITEQKRTEKNQAFLNKASKLLSSSLDYNTTLQSLANLAVEDIADWCAVDLITENNSLNLVAVAHKNHRLENWARKIREENPPNMNEDRGLPNVLKTGKSEIYPYLSDDMLTSMVTSPKQLKLIQQIGIRSIMIVPLIARSKTIGAITFVSSTIENLYNPNSLILAEDLASRAAYAIDNSMLFKTVQEELEERKRVESALSDSEHKFKKLTESNIIGVVSTNIDGTVYEANKTFLEMIGLTEEDIKKGLVQWNKITAPEYYEDDALAIEQVINYGEVAPREKVYIRKDGTQVPVLIGTTLLDAKKGTCLTFVLDITEQKEIEQRKDDFISIASHELKTPVTSIKVFTQLLAKQFEQNDDTRSLALINKMDTQLNKLVNLIADLLDVSRIQSGKIAFRPEKFLLNKLVEDNIESVKSYSPQKIEFRNGIAIPVTADKERIGQVVTNFLTNAVKYSPPDKKIIVSIDKSNREAIVSVKDFGVGISKEDQTQIFDRFYQAKNSETQTYPGLGMGLYISAEIVKRHQGKIWVESTKGKGSHFFFTIPLHDSSTEAE